MRYELEVNGSRHQVEATADTPLLAILRNELGLTAARFGCGYGICGACHVLIDGSAQPACTLPVAEVAGRSIETLEGLADGDRLDPVQQAFLDEDAMQCGYCTSGLIISAVALLRRIPHPDDRQIRDALAGNLCRCGVHARVVRAVQRAAR
jgi:nicotinate dehydrogenase subunit A